MSDLNNSISPLQYHSKKSMQKTMQNNIKKMEMALENDTTSSSSLLKNLKKRELAMENGTTSSSCMSKNVKKVEMGLENANSSSSSSVQKNVKNMELAMGNDTTSSSVQKKMEKMEMGLENANSSVPKNVKKMELAMGNDATSSSMPKNLKRMEMDVEIDTTLSSMIELAMENATTNSSVQKNLKKKELAMEIDPKSSSMQKNLKRKELAMEIDTSNSSVQKNLKGKELALENSTCVPKNLKTMEMAMDHGTSSMQKKKNKMKMPMENDTKISIKMSKGGNNSIGAREEELALLNLKDMAMENGTSMQKKKKKMEMPMENDTMIKRLKRECKNESGGSGCVEEEGILPRHTKVVITGNNRTKSVLVGLQGVVQKTVGLGGWHWLALTNGGEVRLQRNALTVLERPSGNEDDGDLELENEHRHGSEFVNHPAFDGTHKSYRSKRKNKSCVASHKTMSLSLSCGSQSKGSITNPPQSKKVYLSKLSDTSLWRYWRQYNLGEIVPNPTKQQLIDVVQRHFDSQQVDELEVIPAFVKAAKRLKNRK